MMTGEQIKQWIEQSLPHSQVTCEGDGRHFDTIVICPEFAGKSTLQRHRMVYATLGEKMGNDIHALSIKTVVSKEEL